MSPDSLRQRLELRRSRIADDQAAIVRIVARAPKGQAPDLIDLPGLAWLLAATYSEVEEILKAVADHFGETLPEGSTWHRDLLDQMSKPTERRTAVLSEALKTSLDSYRAFRHFSRNATFLVLEGQRMTPLLEGLPALMVEFFREVEAFFARSVGS